jgi:putative peptidoglycan lipid II flippase
MGHLAQVGLALATSIGAWINLVLLAILARRQGFAVSGEAIRGPVAKLAAIGIAFAVALYFGGQWLRTALSDMTSFREETTLGILVVVGGILYFAAVFLILGRGWFAGLMKEIEHEASLPAPVKPDLIEDPTDASESLPDSEPPPKI